MLGTKSMTTSSSMAMVTKSLSPSMLPPSTGTPHPNRTQEDIDKDKLHCNHCNGTRHTEETCFEIQDIQTRAIFGRGTKRRRLYYVEDVVPGRVNQVRSSYNNKTKIIWLWHRRLGHASFAYLKKLLPSLFSGVSESDFTVKIAFLQRVIVTI